VLVLHLNLVIFTATFTFSFMLAVIVNKPKCFHATVSQTKCNSVTLTVTVSD